MVPGSPGWTGRLRNRLSCWRARAAQRVQSWPLRRAHRGLPIPPGRLIYLVAGTEDAAWFLAAGQRAAESVRSVLERQGIKPESLGAVLDFGCGVGRVIRHWEDLANQGVTLHGTDYNPALVAWCRRNLPFARFAVNGLGPGLEYPDGEFDLIYAFSVFTHLSPSSQTAWLTELQRVLKPGGHLLISLHGAYYRPSFTAEERERFDRGEMLIVQSGRQGSNDCAVYHPESYVRNELVRGWELADFVPEGAWGNPNQDLYLLRKPAASSSAAA